MNLLFVASAHHYRHVLLIFAWAQGQELYFVPHRVVRQFVLVQVSGKGLKLATLELFTNSLMLI